MPRTTISLNESLEWARRRPYWMPCLRSEDSLVMRRLADEVENLQKRVRQLEKERERPTSKSRMYKQV